MEILPRKVINVSICIVLFMSGFPVVAQQNLTGVFCKVSKLNEISDCFDFSENKNFKHEISGHLGLEQYGKGHFEIKDSLLILRYDSIPPKFLGYHKTKVVYMERDSIKIQFQVQDLKGTVLPNSAVIIDLENNIGLKTDSNGYGMVNISSKDIDSKSIIVSSLGYENYDFNFKPYKNHDYIINVFLSEPSGIPIGSRTETFNIYFDKKKKVEIVSRENPDLSWEKN